MKYYAKFDTTKNILLPLPQLFKKELEMLEIIKQFKLDDTIAKPIYVDEEILCMWIDLDYTTLEEYSLKITSKKHYW